MKTFYILCLAFAVIKCDSFQKEDENVTEIDFPLTGTWYVNDNGEAYSDNVLNFSEYTFGEPDASGGKLLGKVKLIPFEGEEREGEFEILDENTLVIYLLNENDYTFTYAYFPDNEKVEMNYAGQDRTLVRVKPIIETTEISDINKIKDPISDIAEIEWESEKTEGRFLKFSKPIMEDGAIKGTMEINNSKFHFTGTYEKSSENKYEIIHKTIAKLVDGEKTNNRDYNGPEHYLEFEIVDEGDAINCKWFYGSADPEIEKFKKK